METSIIGALIGAAAAVVSALIGGYFLLRSKPEPASSVPASSNADTVFVDVAVDPGSSEWSAGADPVLNLRETRIGRAARWYIRQGRQLENSDLPLMVTMLNQGSAAAVLTRIGIEVSALLNLWYSGGYYGAAPQAAKIELSGSYELRLPNLMSKYGLDEKDPDEDSWTEVGPDVYELVLEPPWRLEAGAPFHFSLVLKEYDRSMPTHAIFRLWARTNSGTVTSDELFVSFHR